jgi:hypothetical protein
MKVIPDSAGASALDTWLRAATPDADASSGRIQGDGTSVAAASSPSNDALGQPRDTAEDLLVLDIWEGHVPGPLCSAHPLPAADANVQQWAEHIFSPLR